MARSKTSGIVPARKYIPRAGGNGKPNELAEEALRDLVQTVSVKVEANTQEVHRLGARLEAHINDEAEEREATRRRQEAIMSMLGDILGRLPDEKGSNSPQAKKASS